MTVATDVKLGLNVGSGQRPFITAGGIKWVNIDKIDREGQRVDKICDGTNLPYADKSIDFVVLHHVLEHFGCGESSALINEMYRVLKPKASLLVFVPNMEELARAWLAHEISSQIYFTNVYGAYMGNEEDRHKWGFDRQELKSFLSSHNFFPVIPFDWRTIPGADIARDFWILGMECIK